MLKEEGYLKILSYFYLLDLKIRTKANTVARLLKRTNFQNIFIGAHNHLNQNIHLK